MIYLDNASTTQIDPEVLDAMMPFLKDEYGNAGTLYSLGRRAAEAVAIARQSVADLIGATPEQIIFTSGGTESNNMVFKGTRDIMLMHGKNRIITTQIEHDSVLNAVKDMCKPDIKPAFYAEYIAPEQSGGISPEKVIEQIINHDDVGLVSVMHTNNETGIRNKGLKDIAIACNKKGSFFHTDCVQAVGSSDIDVNDICCDFLSISSHKIHGCKGVGALYIKDKEYLSPMIAGGRFQEYGLRGGTENVSGIVGFGKACDIMRRNFQKDREYVRFLRQMLYDCLNEELSERDLDGVMHINGDMDLDDYGKTLNIRFDGVDSETLVLMLDANGVCVSAGSACQSHESNPSHVLIAIGISPDDARCSIRFSLSKMNTEDEIKSAAKIVAECVASLYGMY